MALTKEELLESIRILRERRLAIPAMRDYRPQRTTKKTSSTKAAKLSHTEVVVEDFFSGLIQTGESETALSEAPSADTTADGEGKGGEANGIG